MEQARPAPFTTLLAASSLVVAVLFVAGFSFRWAYFYNFGLRHLALEMPIQSILIGSLELIRSPGRAAQSALIILLPALLFGLLLRVLAAAARSTRDIIRLPANGIRRGFGLDQPIVMDALFALLLLYAAFMAGSLAGFQTFTIHATESPSNPLPAVAVVFAPDEDSEMPVLACGYDGGAPLRVVGDAAKASAIQEFNRLCAIPARRTWRLLHRDATSIYLFATEVSSKPGMLGRPLTAVLPSSDRMIVVME